MSENTSNLEEEQYFRVPVTHATLESTQAFHEAEQQAHKALIDDEIKSLTNDLVIGKITDVEVLQAIAQRIVSERLASFDLTEVALKQEYQTETEATKDKLTGINNRWYGEKQLAEYIRLSEAKNAPLAYLKIDLDNFKGLNDTLGHQAGDVGIKSVANLIASLIRTYDIAYREGGDEFGAVLPGVDAERALAIAERIRTTAEETILPTMQPVIEQLRKENPNLNSITEPFTVSIGISCIDPSNSLYKPVKPSELINQGDIALYNSKHPVGKKAVAKNRVTIFEPGMTIPGPEPEQVA